MAKGKTRLKGLEVSKVDFVDQGCNPKSDIVLTKRQELKAEGFWKGLLAYVRKQMAADPDAVFEMGEELKKAGAQTFDEKISQRSLDRIQGEMWDVCYALEGSLISILRDEELDSDEKRAAMEQSEEEFSEAVRGFIARWSKGTTANVEKRLDGLWEYRTDVLESMKKRLEEKIRKAGGEKEIGGPAEEPGKGEGENDMKIDKSRMTAEDAAQFDRMAKAYGWSEDGSDVPASGRAGGESNLETEVGKGLYPDIQAELEALRKMRQSLEEQELYRVAKKYEGIGKKAEELVPVLRSMKAAGDESYNSYLAVLDEMVSFQGSSGLFSEIGKSGGSIPAGLTEEEEAFQKAKGKGAEIRKARPELTEEAAIDLAIQESPELMEALMERR